MSHRAHRGFFAAAALAAAAAPVARGLAAEVRDAVLFGGDTIAAAEIAACEISAGRATATLSVNGDPLPADGLVRWGEPAPGKRRAGVVLSDGSWLLSDRDWSPRGLVRIDAKTVGLRRGTGWVEAPRGAVRWVVLDPSAVETESARLDPATEDLVVLAGGDRLAARVETLDEKHLAADAAGTPLDTPIGSVAAVGLAGERTASGAAALVGLDDGSLLRCQAFRVAGGAFTAECAGVALEGAANAVVFVQPLGGRATYLSDLEPVDFRHTPYLDFAWPYARDAGLLGGPLAGGGARRAKGLALHSAARIVYRHDGTPARLRADLAVADPAAGEAAGSVAFRVYTVRDGAFLPAYDGPTLRAGDPATPIEIDLTGAAAVALVVDYADGGDAGDHALWLDARIEPAAAD